MPTNTSQSWSSYDRKFTGEWFVRVRKETLVTVRVETIGDVTREDLQKAIDTIMPPV